MLLRIVCRRQRLSIRQIATESAGPSTSSVDVEQPLVKPKSAMDIHRPNYYRLPNEKRRDDQILVKQYLNEGDQTGAGARLWDYYETAKIVHSLPTIAEKIDFVSPYERPWARVEKTWRRAWQPALVAPRKAWALPSSPAYFDCLPFYQNITKTRLVEKDLGEIYEPLNPPTALFEQLFSESYALTQTSSHLDTDEKKASAIISALVDNAMLSVVHNNNKLSDYRIAYNVQSESFWIKAGFGFLYDVKEIGDDTIIRKKPRQISKFIGDDRRYLGELAFVHRDHIAAQVRSQNRVTNLFELNDPEALSPVFPDSEIGPPDVEFSPRVYNLWPDGDILWQCPGYFVNSEETHMTSRLLVKSMQALRQNLAQWGFVESTPEFDEALNNSFKAQAVVSLFATLCAQAHTHGFTQYTDVTSPFTSQLILFDGVKVAFAIGQLNTLAFNIECDGFVNERTNFVQFEGPYDLFEKSATDTENPKVNQLVLKRVIQMLLRD